jgi:hypothetical protein
MKTIEEQAEEYAEALNDIADIMDLPTGNSSRDIVEAVHDMRAHLSGYVIAKSKLEQIGNLVTTDHESKSAFIARVRNVLWGDNKP